MKGENGGRIDVRMEGGNRLGVELGGRLEVELGRDTSGFGGTQSKVQASECGLMSETKANAWDKACSASGDKGLTWISIPPPSSSLAFADSRV